MAVGLGAFWKQLHRIEGKTEMAKRGKHKRNKAGKKARKVERLAAQVNPAPDAGKMPPFTPKEILPVEVFRMGECTVWGGDVWARKGHPWAAIVSLGEHRSPALGPQFETFNGADLVLPTASAMASTSTPPAEIFLDWSDYDGPPEAAKGAEFWLALLADLKGIKGDVLVHCMGGHGRTGTALAAMIHLAPQVGLAEIVAPGDCIVTWVREHYSPQAVESEEQGAFLIGLGASIAAKVEADLSYSANWWVDYKSYARKGTSYGSATSGWGYDSATGATTYKAERYCDMCGVQIAGLSIETELGMYCSDNCCDHDAIMHSDSAKAELVKRQAEQSADPICNCANYGGGVSCDKCDPDWQPMDRAGGER